MRTPQKILATTLWSAAVLGMMLLLALSAARKHAGTTGTDAAAIVTTTDNGDLPTLFNLPQFKLVDQDGHNFTDAQLRGHPFISCFVFTNCAGPCPMMFAKMSAMQHIIPNADIKLVSFTVDPERDTPPVLKAKADELHAQPGRWFFLTADVDSVHKLMREMLQPTPDKVDSPLMHDEHFYLFDSSGACRGRYMSKDDDDMTRLAKDAEMLAERK